MERTDEALVLLYRGGEQAAFAELIARYTDSVYNFSLRLTGNTQDAEDITQEAFIKAWKHLDKFRADEKWKTWLFTIARNSALDLFRKKRGIQFSDMENAEGENWVMETTADEGPLPDSLAIMNEERELLGEILLKIPLLYREVLLLYYQEELNFREIAELTKKPLDTIKSQHRRGIMLLRKLVMISSLHQR